MSSVNNHNKTSKNDVTCCNYLSLDPIGMILIALYHVATSVFFAHTYLSIQFLPFTICGIFINIDYWYFFLYFTEIILAVLVIILKFKKERYIWNIYKIMCILPSFLWGAQIRVLFNNDHHVYSMITVIALILKIYSVSKVEKIFAPKAARAGQVEKSPV